MKILAIVWAYRMTCKILIGHIPFKMFYGKEAVMPMECIVPSLWIKTIVGMTDEGEIEERMS